MSKRYIITLIAVAFISCNEEKKSAYADASSFGKKIEFTGAISVADMEKQMAGKTEMNAKIEAKIIDVCQAKGCWMNVDRGNGLTLMVRMKDHDFFVPKDIAGKNVILEGLAYMDTTSVEMLQHYAEDAGKSDAEVALITEPKVELVFDAEGVLVSK